jgi:hypothetical protein
LSARNFFTKTICFSKIKYPKSAWILSLWRMICCHWNYLTILQTICCKTMTLIRFMCNNLSIVLSQSMGRLAVRWG